MALSAGEGETESPDEECSTEGSETEVERAGICCFRRPVFRAGCSAGSPAEGWLVTGRVEARDCDVESAAMLDARLLTSLVSGSPDGTRFTGVLRSERLARRIAHSRGWPPSGGLGPSPPQERPRNPKKGGKRGSGDQRTDSPGVRIFSGFSHATARAMRARFPVAGRALPAVTRLTYGTPRGISQLYL